VARTKTAKKKKLTEEALKLKEEALQEQPIQDAAPAPTPATGEEVAQAQADLAADPNAQVPVDEAPVEETAPAEEAAPQEDPMFTPPAPGYVPAGWVKIEDLASAVAQATGDTIPAETAPDTQAIQNGADEEAVATTPTAATEEPLVQGGGEVQQAQPEVQQESVEEHKEERIKEVNEGVTRRELFLSMLEDAGLDIVEGEKINATDNGFLYEDEGGCLSVMLIPGLDNWHVYYMDFDDKDKKVVKSGHGWEELINTLINDLDAPGLKDLKAEDYYEEEILHESVEEAKEEECKDEACEGEACEETPEEEKLTEAEEQAAGETTEETEAPGEEEKLEESTESEKVSLTEAEAPVEEAPVADKAPVMDEPIPEEEISSDGAIASEDEEAPVEEAEPVGDTPVEDDTVEGSDPEPEAIPLEDALDNFTDEAEKAGTEYDASYELPEEDGVPSMGEDIPEDKEESDFISKITSFVDDIKQTAQSDKQEAEQQVEEVEDSIEAAAAQFDSSSAFLRSLLSDEDDNYDFGLGGTSDPTLQELGFNSREEADTFDPGDLFSKPEEEEAPVLEDASEEDDEDLGLDAYDDLDDTFEEDSDEEDFEDEDFEDDYESRIPVDLPSRSMRARTHESMYSRKREDVERRNDPETKGTYDSFLPAGSEHFANEENLVETYEESVKARRKAIADFRSSLRENRARNTQLRSNKPSRSVSRFSEALSGRDVMEESMKEAREESSDSRAWVNNRFTERMASKDSLNWKDLLNNGFLG
jgi:hypothetical protein